MADKHAHKKRLRTLRSLNRHPRTFERFDTSHEFDKIHSRCAWARTATTRRNCDGCRWNWRNCRNGFATKGCAWWRFLKARRGRQGRSHQANHGDAESAHLPCCGLGTPTEREKTQWYFQRYVPHLPAAGEMVLFDRSWYNRAGVEHVMGFCTEAEYLEFMRSCPEFERMLVRSGILLIKYWFSVSDEEQERRFQERMKNPTKRWKLSPMDLESRKHWAEYSRAKDEMFAGTDIKQAPWYVVNADNKKKRG